MQCFGNVIEIVFCLRAYPIYSCVSHAFSTRSTSVSCKEMEVTQRRTLITSLSQHVLYVYLQSTQPRTLRVCLLIRNVILFFFGNYLYLLINTHLLV